MREMKVLSKIILVTIKHYNIIGNTMSQKHTILDDFPNIIH